MFRGRWELLVCNEELYIILQEASVAYKQCCKKLIFWVGRHLLSSFDALNELQKLKKKSRNHRSIIIKIMIQI